MVPVAIFLFGSAAIVICVVVWSFSRSRPLLDRWAHENGFELLHSEHRLLFAGPFTWTRSRNQMVYFIRVRDQDGNERSGWLRCGGLWIGLWSDQVEVKWKDEP